MNDLPQVGVQIAAVALSMGRVIAAFAMLPFASREWAGRRVTLPMALAVGLLVPTPLSALPGTPVLILLAVKEAVVGAGLGLLIARVFFVVGATGAVLDQQAGYTFGATLNPTLNTTTGPIESIFMAVLTLMLFDGSGAFVFAKALAGTYGAWPVLSLAPPRAGVLDSLLDHVAGGQAQVLAELVMRLAAPAMALLLLADISMVVAARYAQQLQPFSIALALKALVMALLFGWMLRGQLGEWAKLIRVMVPAP
jgi:type III secretory pathway component EscT